MQISYTMRMVDTAVVLRRAGYNAEPVAAQHRLTRAPEVRILVSHKDHAIPHSAAMVLFDDDGRLLCVPACRQSRRADLKAIRTIVASAVHS